MGKNSKHHRKQNQMNNKTRRRIKKALAAAGALPISSPSQNHLWPVIPDIMTSNEGPLDVLLPVRTREGQPAVILLCDVREKEYPIHARVVRKNAYTGTYNLKGQYTPNRGPSPLDLFNVSLSEWREKMGANWDLSQSKELT